MNARLASIAQLLDHVAGEKLFDLTMSRDWLTLLGARVLIPIVLASMPDEHATHRCQLLDQFNAFHET
jgi:hypothetical protein